MGPSGGRCEHPPAARCVVRGRLVAAGRRGAARRRAQSHDPPIVPRDRGGAAATVVGRVAPLRRRGSSAQLGLPLRGVPTLQPPRAVGDTCWTDPVRALRRRVSCGTNLSGRARWAPRAGGRERDIGARRVRERASTVSTVYVVRRCEAGQYGGI